MFVLFSIAFFLYLVSFILHKYNRIITSKIPFININNYKFRQGSEVLVLVFSIVIFSTTTVVGRWGFVDSSPYPWENRYLSGEEKEIINFFQNEDVSGLIYTNFPEIANRISAVGFLPVFSDRTPIGIALYYGFISPNEVYEYTEFSLSGLFSFNFLIFNEYDPIRSIRNKIVRLNVSLAGDLNLLQFEYNIQYIISGNNIIISTDARWTLIPSLSTVFTPVFSTPNLLVWKLY